jgi:DNA polymerase-1
MTTMNQKSNNNILVLDGYNLIYRARYSGRNTGEFTTVFNFFRSLRSIIEKFNPDLCYFVLEGRPVKRLAIDSNYKGQRTYHNKDNFQEQRRKIIEITKNLLPIVVVKHDDYECDDIANFLANEKHADDNAIIISTDTDFIQSINEKTRVFNPVKKDYFQSPNYNYIMWKSLVGDKSDNIIGFSGIGNKKAIKLLENKEKLEDFLSIEENNQKFLRNNTMIKFHDLNDDINEIKYYNKILSEGQINWEQIKSEFSFMGFKSIVEKEKSWNKFKETFEKLLKGERYVRGSATA